MNGKLAKKIRKQVYGPDGASRLRQHFMLKPPKGYRPDMSEEELFALIRRHGPGQIIADKKRQIYQMTKKIVRQNSGQRMSE